MRGKTTKAHDSQIAENWFIKRKYKKQSEKKNTYYTNRMTTESLSGTMQDRRQWKNFFNVLTEQKLSSQISLSRKKYPS